MIFRIFGKNEIASGIHLSVLGIFLLLSGCAVNYAVPEADVPIPAQSALPKIPLTVGIMQHDEHEMKDSFWQSPQLASVSVTLAIPTGKILNKYTPKTISNVFEKTILLGPQDNVQPVDMILSTEIVDINQTWPPSYGMSSRYQFITSIHAVLTDRKGRKIWEKTVQSPKPSSGEMVFSVDEKAMGKVATMSAIEALNAVVRAIRNSQEIRQVVDNKQGHSIQIQAQSPQNSTPTILQPQPKPAVSDVDTGIPTGKPAGKYDVAVIIGNANYSSTGTPNVDFALQDAQIMRQYLIKAFGYDPANIIYVENATLTKLNEIFGTSDNHQGKLFSWIKPGQSRIFIYYVGHGAPDQQTGEGYFVPVDANPQYISTSGYKLSTFYENISKVPALKKTVVIDACFSGSSANGQLLKGVSGLTARLKSEPKASAAADLLLTSAGMDQVASWYPEKGHSLFTYFFLKGIQGEADGNKDGRITMGEMRSWLSDQVPYMARRITGNQQQPVIIGNDGDELVEVLR